MDSHYLQQQRFQLQKRVRRLNSCDHTLFHSALVAGVNYPGRPASTILAGGGGGNLLMVRGLGG